MIDNDTKRLSRLTAILTQLQTKRLITATMLADKFKVSIRTIYRDIRALEQSGIPVLTDEGKGYYLMEGYRLPPVSFTEGEANAMITAGKLIAGNRDASFISEYKAAVDKIKAVLRPEMKKNAELLLNRMAIAQSSLADAGTSYLTSLQLALTNFCLVKIEYQKEKSSQTTPRVVEPFAVLSSQGNWLLLAYCRLRREFRLFRLDRIKHLQVQTDTFEPHKMTLQEYFERH